MKVVLLCGGIGRRMAPITKPKPLLKLTGKPLIFHQITTAMEAGLNRFVIVANKDNIADLKNAVAGLEKVEIEFTTQERPLGMADALLSAFNSIPEPFILASSDDIVEPSAYAQLMREYQKTNDYFAYLTAYKVQNYFPGGYLVIDEQGEIRRIVEKPPRGEEPSRFINVALHLFSRPKELLSYLSKVTGNTDDAYERTIDQIIQEGHRIKAVKYHGSWQTIKYPWHILEAMDYFLRPLKRQISPSAQISNRSVIDGEVVIEDGVRVFEGAVIRGPSCIGRNTIIGNNVLVRNSNIGDNCVIGFNTEIKHTYVGDGCWFHSNYVGDSVIEDDCSFGAGTVTANLRLDDRSVIIRMGDDKIDSGHDKLGSFVGMGSRFGVNVSLLPGIRVGARSLVGAHVYLTDDLPPGKMALAEPQYHIQPYENMTDAKRK